MLRKIFLSFILLFTYISVGFAARTQEPRIVCNGLPGCNSNALGQTDVPNAAENTVFQFLGKVISEGIGYVAVVAVLSLMVSGIMFLISAGDEDKVTKARKWITWSLVGVLLSVSAWSLIKLINSFSINGL